MSIEIQDWLFVEETPLTGNGFADSFHQKSGYYCLVKPNDIALEEWMSSNFTGEYVCTYIGFQGTLFHVWIKERSDAMLFQLKWGGKINEINNL